MGLNYFGARYYDADIGLWTSVDPMRQYWSGYSYTGNGFSPINGVDSDGNYFEEGSNAMDEYNYAKENDFWGSDWLKTDLNEMYNSETLYTVSYGDDNYSSGDKEVWNIEMHKGLTGFERSRVFRHEGDHGTFMQYEKDLRAVGVYAFKAIWHNQASDKRKANGWTFEKFLIWNSSLPRDGTKGPDGDRWDSVYGRDRGVTNQYKRSIK